MAAVCDICGKGPGFGGPSRTRTAAPTAAEPQHPDCAPARRRQPPQAERLHSCLKAGKVTRA